MEALIVLVLLGLLGASLTGPTLSIIGLFRIRGLSRRADRAAQLEVEVAELRRRVEALEPAPEVKEPTVAVPPRPHARASESPAPPPRAPRKRTTSLSGVDWERWIGIRGAALLGAIALGLAGLLFFRYSIEQGLITPMMRVALGTFVGLGCLAGSRVLRSRGYRVPAAGVAGAGIAILYAAFWAAHTLYGLIGLLPAFLLMALVTGACCLLALRDRSFVIAALGLIGGFATPLLLSAGPDRPFGLFGYVLLLDLGLLFLGRRLGWPALGLASLGGTVLLEAVWIGGRMGPDRVVLGMGILVLFAAVFLFAGRGARGVWSQLSAVAFPFAFAVYFAARVELMPRLYPMAILLAILGGAACWLARERRMSGIAAGAAAASVAVVGVWLFRHPLTLLSAWELVGVATGLSVVFLLFAAKDRRRPRQEAASAAQVASLGMFPVLLVGASTSGIAPWVWLAGWAAQAAILYVLASFPGRAPLQILGALGCGAGLSLLHRSHLGDPTFPGPLTYLAVLVGSAIVFQGMAVLRRRVETREWADYSAALVPVVLLIGLVSSPLLASVGPWPALGASLLLGGLVLVAATRRESGPWYAAALLSTAAVHWNWSVSSRALADRPELAGPALGLQLLAVGVFTGWLFASRRAFATRTPARCAAALAAPIWFLPMLGLFRKAYGADWVGALPIVLAVVSLVGLGLSRRLWADDPPRRLAALAWFGAVALLFLTAAVPLQLDREWLTIAWALEGLAVIALWKRLDHPGLKYLGLALFGAVTLRLVSNPALLGYHEWTGIRLFNWLLYTYLVPAAALVAGARLLHPLEVTRLRGRERGWYTDGRPLGAIASSLGAIAVVFVWMNLEIAGWFAVVPQLRLSFGTDPGQRLTLSIAWAVYALALLALGLARSSRGLRWISLAFLVATIAKVFLYDLGRLHDLYRVGSLVGLAASLILVSLLYQRFVFRESRPAP